MVNVIFIILAGGNRREIQVPAIKYSLIHVCLLKNSENLISGACIQAFTG
jgi:hypothetical protein